MHAKATIAGHPIHPMLIAIPVAFYTATLVAFIVYASNGEMAAFRFGVVCNIIGAAGAILAAIPGFVDWAFGIPTGTRAKRDGLIHLGLNVMALVLFIVNAAYQGARWNAALPDAISAIVLSGIGVLLTAAAGSLGWILVQTHHVGVHLTPEQEAIDRRQEQAPAPGAGEPLHVT